MGLPFWVSVKSGNLCIWPFLQEERSVQGFYCFIYSMSQQRCNNHCCLCKIRLVIIQQRNGVYYLKYSFHHCFHVIKIPIDSLNKISAGRELGTTSLSMALCVPLQAHLCSFLFPSSPSAFSLQLGFFYQSVYVILLLLYFISFC